ncbi:hypothetical protein [Streptomyces sp. NPDC047043]|uniref:hypothetical protein n=1 Tax=Streptomyces sp. NPDC047043 TaxID=3154497 RepID=UPI0033E6A37F
MLFVGSGGGIARAVVLAARDTGARVVTAGRDRCAPAHAYAGEPALAAEAVDLTDERRSPPSANGPAPSTTWCPPPRHACGRLADPDRDAVGLSFDTRVTSAATITSSAADT